MGGLSSLHLGRGDGTSEIRLSLVSSAAGIAQDPRANSEAMSSIMDSLANTRAKSQGAQIAGSERPSRLFVPRDIRSPNFWFSKV